MKQPWHLSFPLLVILLSACGPSPSSQTMASQSANVQNMSDADVWNQELRVLQRETPKTLNLEWFYKDFGYSEWPGKIFARKKQPNDKDKEDSPAHRFLIRLGQQIFQQALLADKSGDSAYADNALLLIRRLTDSKLGFINDPAKPDETNDNRYLEIGWFLNLVARGARILDLKASEEWKNKNNWNGAKSALNQWIGTSVDQHWDMKKDALNQTPLNLAAQAGTMNWVGDIDTKYGATNRTFAMLEAQMRVAELRGGRLGPMKLVNNNWQAEKQHDGSIWQIFQTFRGYLKYYFNVPLNNDPKKFVLNYNKGRKSENSDPNILNIEPCRDPSNYGFKADCLVNKDAYRNDTFHPLMGFASILNIIDIAKRWGYDLTPEEHEKVIMGLRWVSFNNTPGVTGNPANGIAVWEVAFRLYNADKLGPYCKRDLAASRGSDSNKRADLAWGYSRVALGY